MTRLFSTSKEMGGAALLVFILSTAVAPAFTLVEKGAPRATIVVRQSALTPAKDDVAANKISTAAHDLQDYIKKISGAELPLVADDKVPSGAAILVGPSLLTDAMKADIPSGLTAERHEEGFILRSTGDRLILAGNDAGPYHGTEYATYEFLNKLGVRWFMPGDFGEVVPKMATVTTGDLNLHEKPDFIQRNWWLHTTPEMLALETRWKIRNKMNPDNMFNTPGDGSVSDFTAPVDQAKTHPELFGKNFDGSINTGLPNLSNPDTVKIAADKALAYFQAHPDQNSIGMAPADGLPRDFNPDTVKLNQGFSDPEGREGVPAEMSATEEWIKWVNAVAREVNKTYPDRIITTNGYADRNMAPFGVKTDPHLGIEFAAIWSDTLHAYDNPKSWQMQRQGEILQGWTGMNDKVWIYGYDYIMLVSALTPVPATHKLAHDFPLMKKWGVAGFDNESRNVWIERGIATRYLNARLMWDANADVNAIVNDYYAKWYGAAAAPSKAFWEALEDTMENTVCLGHEDRILPQVYTPELLARLKTDIGSAESLATTPNEKQHVQIDRLILDHLEAYMAMSRADYSADFVEAVRQGNLMWDARKKLNAINSFLVLASEKDAQGNVDYNSGVFYWGLTDRIQYYQRMVDQMSGKTGTLVALLPEQGVLSLDPEDEGRFAGWWRSNWDTKNWNPVTTARPFYLQGPPNQPYIGKNGYPYLGTLWYQFKVNVPASTGKVVKLYVPDVEAEAWVWVNDQYVGHRPYRETYERPNDMEVEVSSALKPGAENIITFRVSTSLNRAAAADGLFSRPFLYTPTGDTAVKTTME